MERPSPMGGNHRDQVLIHAGGMFPEAVGSPGNQLGRLAEGLKQF